MNAESKSTSWNKIGKWYDDTVGEQGHYYHQTLIIPNVMKMLDLPSTPNASLLDLACGQGVLSRQLPSSVTYTGLDLATSLIRAARQYDKNTKHEFIVADATKGLPITKKDFTHAAIILALQNIQDPFAVFKNASKHLIPGAKFVIVLNHPCFRIPRQSSWKVDLDNKIQYRRIDRYMSDMKIPIQTHPGKGQESPQSWTFHHPLSSYCYWLKEAGFSINLIDEWCSNKVSEGKAAKMENRSREEIPLFMAIVATKNA
ncbi:MAG: class I SAM-dependent methyltransferase [Parachlamydiaceae bacterium]|nr:class I SAM-dependent methyltransferase [Parachlamydiaceae bacterium]